MSDIRTLCVNCVFRKNDENGIQNDCALGRLHKFIDRGESEFNGEYYTINRFCNTCRDRDYTEESIMKEIELSCSFLVYGWNDYWITLKSISKQTVKPKSVYVLFDDPKLFNMEKYKEYKELYSNLDIPLIFKRFFKETNFLEAIDDTVPKLKSQYYIPIKGQIERDFIEKFNNMINIDMLKINAYFNKSIFNSFISCSLHRIFNGNKVEPLSSKVKKYINGDLDILPTQKEKETILFNE